MTMIGIVILTVTVRGILIIMMMFIMLVVIATTIIVVILFIDVVSWGSNKTGSELNRCRG